MRCASSGLLVTAMWAAAGLGHAQFATVINLPPDPAPASIGAGTQINVWAGGAVGNNFVAHAGSELNISGGTVGTGAGFYGTANFSGGVVGSGGNAGGTVNITGGSIGADFDIFGIVNMSGGIVDGHTDVYDGARLTISGGAWGAPLVIRGGQVIAVGDEFRLDGEPVSGLGDYGSELTLTLPMGSTLSGTLADGTPTAFSSWLSIPETPVILTLRRAALPVLGPAHIDVPTDAAPQGIRAGQTLRLANDGTLPREFRVGRGAKLEVTGGVVGKRLLVAGGSASVSGGTVDDGLTVLDGATVDLSAGSIRRSAVVAAGATLNVSGGTMDGDSYIYDEGVLNVSGGTVGADLRARGGEVNLAGGQIGERFKASAGAVVNVTGGVLDANAMIGNEYNSGDHGTVVVNLAGGTIYGRLSTTNGAVMNISSGFLGGLCTAGYGSRWNISGGYIYDEFTIGNGSDVHISGGIIGHRLTVGGTGGPATISGGAFGDSFKSLESSRVTFVGGDFQVDGAAIAGLEDIGNELAFNVPAGALLTGRFADGTPFAFSTDEGDSIANGTLTLRRAALPSLPEFIQVTGNTAPLGVGAGQTLLVDVGGIVGNHANAGRGSIVRVVGGRLGENFEAVGARVEIAGGEVARGFDAFGSEVMISGGRIDGYFDARSGSRIHITGGSVGDDFFAHQGSVVNISGGSIERWFRARSGSVVNISGGSIWGSFQAEGGSTVNMTGGLSGLRFTAQSGSDVTISGGELGSSFAAEAGSHVTFEGTEFFLNGVRISGLSYDVARTITTRNQLLSGVLADGSPFSLQLSPRDISATATLQVTRVFGFGDFDHDGDVDGGDLIRWQNNAGTGATHSQGDADGDGDVDGGDFLLWQRQLGRGGGSVAPSAVVPEPDAMTLLFTVGLAAILHCQRQMRR